jgi:hypothetical protein
VLVDRSKVTGTVFQAAFLGDPDPAPFQGAVVRLFRIEDYPSGSVVRVTTTNSQGRFEFSDLDAPAIYVVDYGFPAELPSTSRQVVVDAGATVDVVEPDYLKVVLGP